MYYTFILMSLEEDLSKASAEEQKAFEVFKEDVKKEKEEA